MKYFRLLALTVFAAVASVGGCATGTASSTTSTGAKASTGRTLANQQPGQQFSQQYGSTGSPQAKAFTTAQKQQKPLLPRIQDDFAELDDTVSLPPVTAGISDKFLMTTLEHARQQYLRALSFVNKNDTARAAKLFETSVETLNKIADFPKIEEHQDFTDLLQMVIEDYEKYIRSIDNLSESSPFFVLRDKFFQEVDKDALPYNELAFTRNDRDRPSRQQVVPLVLPESGSALVQAIGMKNVQLQVPMTDNEIVQKTMEFFTNEGGRRYFQKWMQRAGRWFPMMRRIAREEGAPEEIAYLAMIESGLSNNAVSWAKAVGMWQFIKSTGELYGLEAGYWYDERRDPEKATRAAMRHLRDLYNEFGDWHLALAAYNCGVGGVRRAIARSGISNPNYWDIRPKLPRETRNYVPLYLAAAKVCMNPEAYGFVNVPLEEQYRYDTVVVNDSYSFRALAQAANLPEEAIEEFNPELIQRATPPGMEYEVKLPPGTKNTFLANLDKLSKDEKRSITLHEVGRGETLYSIASKYGVSAQVLASANGMTGRKKRLYVGMKMKIPTQGKYIERGDAEEDSPAASAPVAGDTKAAKKERSTQEQEQPQEQEVASDKSLAAQNTGKEATDKQSSPAKPLSEQPTAEKKAAPSEKPLIPYNTKRITHTVAAGETLYSIAQRYRVEQSDIRSWNALPAASDRLSLGAELTLYVAKSFRDTDKELAKNAENLKHSASVLVHKVQSGETLAQIADDYRVSMDEIRTLTGMRSRDKIYVGKVLKIPVTPANAGIAERRRDQEEEQTPPNTNNAVLPAPRTNNTAILHTVKKGETLHQIARAYNVSVADVQEWNPTTKNGHLSVGMELNIRPRDGDKGGGASTTLGSDNPRNNAKETHTTSVKEPSRTEREEQKSAESVPESKLYTVRKGDTLYSLSKKFGLSVSQLLSMNKGLSQNTMSAGQRIRVKE